MGKQLEPVGHWLLRTCTLSQTPLNGAYCNALLLVHWPVRKSYKISI